MKYSDRHNKGQGYMTKTGIRKPFDVLGLKSIKAPLHGISIQSFQAAREAAADWKIPRHDDTRPKHLHTWLSSHSQTCCAFMCSTSCGASFVAATAPSSSLCGLSTTGGNTVMRSKFFCFSWLQKTARVRQAIDLFTRKKTKSGIKSQQSSHWIHHMIHPMGKN